MDKLITAYLRIFYNISLYEICIPISELSIYPTKKLEDIIKSFYNVTTISGIIYLTFESKYITTPRNYKKKNFEKSLKNISLAREICYLRDKYEFEAFTKERIKIKVHSNHFKNFITDKLLIEYETLYRNL